MTAKANKPFTLALLNLDADTGHNVHIVNSAGKDPLKYAVEGIGFAFVDYGKSAVFQVPALAPGKYPFTCDAHPEMTGALTVQ